MKNNKKIIIILLLLLFVGVTGYSVYSYYWADGEYTSGVLNKKNYIVFTNKFNPRVSTTLSSSSTFLGNLDNESYDFICNDDTATCSGTIYFSNKGDSSIIVKLDEEETSISSNYSVHLSPSYSWTSTQILPNQTASFTVTVQVSLSETFEDTDEAIQADAPIGFKDAQIDAHIAFIAEQEH